MLPVDSEHLFFAYTEYSHTHTQKYALACCDIFQLFQLSRLFIFVLLNENKFDIIFSFIFKCVLFSSASSSSLLSHRQFPGDFSI